MIDKIAELNIALWSLSKLMDNNKCAVRELVIDEYKKNTIEGRMPDYDLTINYSSQLGLIRITDNVLELCSEGENYIFLNRENPYDLSEQQKIFLVRTCFLNGSLRKETKDCLKCFVESNPKGTFVWSEFDNTPLGNLYWVAEHLFQLGILKRNNNGYEVKSTYVETIATFLIEPKGWTEEEFDEWRKEKKEVGDFAESVIKKYEEKRLKNLGYVVESHSVRPVGKLKVNAGYDIESFDGKSDSINYDRFIEVKGSKDSKLRFIWSANEMEVAKKLGEKYWIYFQGGIDIKKKAVKNQPLLIQDPYKYFFIDKKLPINAHGYIVQANISGDIIKTK